MLLPVTIIASDSPDPSSMRHVDEPGAVWIASRAAADRFGIGGLITRAGLTVSEPDVDFPSPGCVCCSVREDLVQAIVRATRRRTRPSRIVIVVDLGGDDLLTVISTVLSSFEINRRCSLDAVVVQVDGVGLATRYATGTELADARLTGALAVADRIVIGRQGLVTETSLAAIRANLTGSAGFAQLVDVDTAVIRPGERLDAWHGAPAARPVSPARVDDPVTVVLRVDEPLDAAAIDEWLDQLVARHATRLARIQGALAVHGHADRTCCFGVRSFARSHSESEHAEHRSTESIFAICGVGLDAEELSESFRATVAS